MTLLAGLEWVAVDVETTGWSPHDAHGILEVACVSGRGEDLGEEWSSLVQPGRPVPPDAIAIHGIDDAMLAGAPAAASVAPEFRRRCADHLLVLHNAAFDLAFLRRLVSGAGLPALANPVLDTLGLARGLFGSGGNTLGELVARLGLPAEVAHRALPDARTTARALVVLARTWERERGTAGPLELAAASLDAIRLSAARPQP